MNHEISFELEKESLMSDELGEISSDELDEEPDLIDRSLYYIKVEDNGCRCEDHTCEGGIFCPFYKSSRSRFTLYNNNGDLNLFRIEYNRLKFGNFDSELREPPYSPPDGFCASLCHLFWLTNRSFCFLASINAKSPFLTKENRYNFDLV